MAKNKITHIDQELYYTCLKGPTVKIEKLIQEGADLHYKNSEGRTCMHALAISGNISGLKLLIEYNISVNPIDTDGNTPLHFACLKSEMDTIIELLSNGAYYNIKNNEGNTPLDLMPDHDYVEIAEKEYIQTLVNENMQLEQVQKVSAFVNLQNFER